jgi:uncharacterized protein (TIGR02145 family)
MKPFFILLAALTVFLYSCTTDNTNTTTVVPIAPSGLTATVVSTTQVNLSWTDNSTNESGYKIQRKTTGGSFADIGSTGVDLTNFSDQGLSANTTYTYRVYGFNAAGNSLQYSNEVVVTTDPTNIMNPPTVSTTSVTSITATSAVTGGNVTLDGGANVTARGVCWSTSNNPTIALSTKTIDGTGNGSFTSNITGLAANTTYFVRAYATNSAGTSYGAEVTFRTTNGSAVNLPSVTIGTQIWSSKNLDVARYRNGDPIPQVTDPTQWANLTTGAWCWYNNDSATYAATYGRLYNWYAVNDPRGLAPQGWRIPTEGDWNRLVKFIDPASDTTCRFCTQSSTAGGAMKSVTGWNAPNTGATNSSGFAGLPGGFRYFDGSFNFVGVYGFWWSAGEFDATNAWYRYLSFSDASVIRSNGNKTYGFSVRVVRD